MRIARVFALAAFLGALSWEPSAAADAVAGHAAGSVSLGNNWGAYETYRGTSFRWVDNDAEIVLRAAPDEAHIGIACEGGPSLGQRVFALRVLDGAHRQVDHVVCNGSAARQELLLPGGRGPVRYFLHVDGGGKRVPGERRILNFRVFYLDDVGGALADDVGDPGGGVRIGSGWYPVEHYNGQTFRWMQNDGRLVVRADRAKGAVLRLLLEPGPSIGSRDATVTVADGHGRRLIRTVLSGRGGVTIPLQLERGDNDVVVSVATHNVAVPGDRRRLSLRLFSATLQR